MVTALFTEYKAKSFSGVTPWQSEQLHSPKGSRGLWSWVCHGQLSSAQSPGGTGAAQSSLAALAGTAHTHCISGQAPGPITSAALSCSVSHAQTSHRRENHTQHGLQKVLSTIRVNPSLISKYTFEGYFIIPLIGFFNHNYCL